MLTIDDFSFLDPLDRCPACSGGDLGHAFTSVADEYSIAGFTLDRCAACATHFVNPRPTGAGLTLFYEDLAGSNPNYVRTSLGYYLDETRRARMRSFYLEPLLARRREGRLLDFGAGAGWFMKLAEDEGFSVSGFDLLPAAVEAGRDELGLGGLEIGGEGDLPATPTYDVIAANSSIEHLIDPAAFAARAAAALLPGGLAMFTFPSSSSFMFRELGAFSYLTMAPYHLTHFSDEGMRAMLEGAGLRVVGMERIPYTGRWAHGIAHKRGMFENYRRWREDPEFIRFDMMLDDVFDELADLAGLACVRIAFAERAEE